MRQSKLRAMKSLTNNFDFLRLSAAMMVLYSHQFALLGHAQPTALLGISFGELGVCIFFSISGYLVTQSWTRDPNVIRFAAKRVLRIWPGLFIATCFGALVIGLIATDLPWLAYLLSPEMHGYFTSLRMKMQFSLPGVFLGIPFPHAVNGSLWTIPLEVSCYIALLIAGIIRVTSFRWITLLGVVRLALYFFGTDRSGIDVIANYRLQYGLFFGAGACMWLFRECWATRRFVGTLLLLAGAAVAIWSRQYMIACLLMVPYASS